MILEFCGAFKIEDLENSGGDFESSSFFNYSWVSRWWKNLTKMQPTRFYSKTEDF